jgi:hypothetical protein
LKNPNNESHFSKLPSLKTGYFWNEDKPNQKGFGMTDSIRIKRFLKKGIQANILSVDQLLLLSADDLMEVAELDGIDEGVMEQTLDHIKTKMVPPKSSKQPKAKSVDNIMKLIERKAGMHLDAVRNILHS